MRAYLVQREGFYSTPIGIEPKFILFYQGEIAIEHFRFKIFED